MVHRAFGHSNPSCTLHSPCSAQTEQGFCFLVGNGAWLGIATHVPRRNFRVAVLFPKRK